MRELPTPSNLLEVRRYVDKEVGSISEFIPRNPQLPVVYMGEVNVDLGGGPQHLTFKLPGPTLEDAIAGWQEALSGVIDDIEEKALRRQLLAPAASMRRA